MNDTDTKFFAWNSFTLKIQAATKMEVALLLWSTLYTAIF